MPKTPAERVRAFRERERAGKPFRKGPAKTAAQRAREYRARKKLKNAVAALISSEKHELTTVYILPNVSS